MEIILVLSGLVIIWVFWLAVAAKGKPFATSLPDYQERFLVPINHGRLPYRDFSFEYPPLFSGGLYGSAFLSSFLNIGSLINLHFLITVPVFFTLYIRLVPGGKKIKTLPLLFLLVIPAMSSFDFIPALVTLLSLILAVRKHLFLSVSFLALAVGWKLYPLVLLPVVLIGARSRRRRSGYILWFLALMTLPYLFFVFAGGLNGVLAFLRFHLGRGVAAESVLAIHANAAGFIDLLKGKVIFSRGEVFYGDWENVIGWVSLLVFILLYLISLKKLTSLRGHPDSSRRSAIFKYAVFWILLVLVFSKVLSPQYLIWYIFLIPFLEGRDYRVAYFSSLVILVFTILELQEIPLSSRTYLTPLFLTTVTARNLLLVVLFFYFLKSVFRGESGGTAG